MIPLTGALKEFSGSIALMALMAVAYGAVVRTTLRASQARLILGVLFGVAAMLAMHDRIPIADGIFVDLRHLPVALAGGFLGWQGALVAATMAAAMRIGIGGAGAPSGVVAILIAGSAGLLWHHWTRKAPRRGVRSMLGLALATSAYAAATFLLPATLARHLLAFLLPVMIPLHLVGVLVVGLLIERERNLHSRERLLLRDADHDPLTGLLNRRGFERAVAGLPRSGAGALLLLDIDHFKRVNDVHGHAAGDAVLCALGARLSSQLGAQDLLARLGGEELVAFLPRRAATEARTVARRLCESVRGEPFALPGGGSVAVTVSVGGAWCTSAAVEVLMARADAALYAAKHAGRDRCRFAAERPTLADGLASATESACTDCSRCQVCCGDRIDGHSAPVGLPQRSVA